MPAFRATAPGKVILAGEHAVVYGRPALAVPVTQVSARATVTANPRGAAGDVWISAPDIHLESALTDLPTDHPLALAIAAVQAALHIDTLPALRVRVTATIPIAAGLGSGAAVSVAIARALSGSLGHPLEDAQISQIAFSVDQKHHGTPSGIDNTVIAYAQPVYFRRDQPFTLLEIAQPFTLVIANSGIASPTAAVVADVRAHWQAHPAQYEALFDGIAALTVQARQKLETGDLPGLGVCLTENHALLQRMDVSAPALDRLVSAAMKAGALGAKLCGGGRGGNMIALIDVRRAPEMISELQAAGAVQTILTTIEGRSYATR